MILTCNSCGKKFVVPDGAITASGRTVQCGSCGNKWKQFPINEIRKTPSLPNTQKKVTTTGKIQPKTKKTKKNVVKKSREINLYSPEYLAKKHGIKLHDNKNIKKISNNKKIKFGFYNSLILFLVLIIVLSRSLYFFQDFIIAKLPFTKFYIEYFFENIRNMFEIWKNLISNY